MSILSNREQKAVNKKWHISETAMALFKERGYNSVKVKEICKAADISLGTFYHYFSSKDSIIDETYQIIDERIFECLDEREFNTPIDKILGILEQSACIMQEELGYVLMLGSYYQIISSKPDYSYSHDRNLYITLVETLKEGISTGYFKKDTDPEEIAELCLRIGRGAIIDWCLKGGSYKLCDLIVSDLKRMLHSIIIN
ncbi:MAG: TetR/AcrR family transcriptional regulator [Pleomorphochaeta sp.]